MCDSPTETGLYYLQSRYYDPEICRFINADGYASTGQGLLGGNAFTYCLNNPSNNLDSLGRIPMRTYNVLMTDSGSGNSGYIASKIIETTSTDIAYFIYYSATKWHFEDRDKKNGTHPTYQEVSSNDSGWTLLPKNESIYHDNGVGKPELKFIHPDGREAVFDGDTLQPMQDPKYKATYNYSPLYQMPKDRRSNLLDYLKLCSSGLGHLFADMLPYYLTGMSNTREQFEEKIRLFAE
ncbi:MAG: hypothetical protein IK082_06955 [Oscillospiraceae bacterium]|nr:hypothetical protein [Oscillospiraceae bacterium]